MFLFIYGGSSLRNVGAYLESNTFTFPKEKAFLVAPMDAGVSRRKYLVSVKTINSAKN